MFALNLRACEGLLARRFIRLPGFFAVSPMAYVVASARHTLAHVCLVYVQSAYVLLRRVSVYASRLPSQGAYQNGLSPHGQCTEFPVSLCAFARTQDLLTLPPRIAHSSAVSEFLNKSVDYVPDSGTPQQKPGMRETVLCARTSVPIDAHGAHCQRCDCMLELCYFRLRATALPLHSLTTPHLSFPIGETPLQAYPSWRHERTRRANEGGGAMKRIRAYHGLVHKWS